MNSTHFTNGEMILEPLGSSGLYHFENEISLYAHVLEHVVAMHYRERWDELGIFQRDKFHRTLNNETIQRIKRRSLIVLNQIQPRSKSKKQERKFTKKTLVKSEFAEEQRQIDVKLNESDFLTLQGIPEFVELVDGYQKIVAQLLSECSYNVYSHYHILKSRQHDDGSQLKQVIKILDSQNGLIVVASAPYMVDVLTGVRKFCYSDKYVIVTGYRYWRSKSQAEREEKFSLLAKEFKSMELKHDREFQKVEDVQKHDSGISHPFGSSGMLTSE